MLAVIKLIYFNNGAMFHDVFEKRVITTSSSDMLSKDTFWFYAAKIKFLIGDRRLIKG